MSRLRRYLAAGLLIWIPLGVTFLVVRFLIRLMDRTLDWLPTAWHPDSLLGFHVPGLGIVLVVLVVLVTGVVAANFFGRQLVSLWESLLRRIPLVRSIYTGVKQVAETMLSDSAQSFRQVVLVEYPRRDSWTLAFMTGRPPREVRQRLGEDAVSVFVPTTPNPTSGFFLMVPRDDIIALDMSVDDGLKMLLSLGVVTPGEAPVPSRS